jgi:hypothetical protein
MGGLGRMFENMDITLRAGDSEGSGGTAWWDYESGVLVELRQTQNIVIDVKIRGKDRPTDSQPAASGPGEGLRQATITQKFTTSVQIDLLEDGPTSGSSRPASTGGIR